MTALVNSGLAAFTAKNQKVLDFDPAGISGVGTDVSIDFSQDRTFRAGRPADTASLTSGVFSVTISNAGTGGSNGTRALAFSGGGGSGAAGTATIAGGVVTAVTVTNPGTGYTSNPTITVPGAGLIGVNLQPVLGVLKNSARDVNALLSRTQPVSAQMNSNSARPVRNGAGVRFAPTTNLGMYFTKNGIANNRVFEPTLEGFIDQLVLLAFRCTAFQSGASPFMVGLSNAANQVGGWLQSGTSGNFTLVPGGISVPGWTDGVPLNQLVQLGYLTRYNVGANTTSHYLIRNGVMRTTAAAGTAPASMLSNIAGALANLGGGGTSQPAPMTGTHYHFYRELVGLGGLTNEEVAVKAAQHWAYAQGAFA